ncbi:50S ribosomal protein L9 [candidate division WOR-3 bacterium]|uniref:Large ribosomal subunit protein bL9 n=1 Tax=candidate division WOR-3 bacterium TaxID=2052148 RepID=A0A9D5K7A5_UNCW3|nr:50S ribosomal protein L9 [candidate division WOR-3 bacterium]MBD3363587.1 50S ribosomal protein L9 [candidate division WOR-3 bacterium]
MEVILTQDVVKLGNRGEVVRVKSGYARNYLIPRKMALPATSSNKRHVAEIIRQTKAKVEKERSSAELLYEKLNGEHIKLNLAFGETGKAYGSITAKDIASSFRDKDIYFDHHQVILDHPLKEAGSHDVQIKLFEGVTATVKVWVVPEGDSPEPESIESAEKETGKEEDTEDTAGEASIETEDNEASSEPEKGD